jgi:ribonuclease III
VPGGVRRIDGRSNSAEGHEALSRLFDSLPDDLRRHALTHSSWVERRTDSYGRLAFLGDSVLGLAIAEHLFERYPRSDIGRLTKVHGQAVSGRACAEVATEMGLVERVRTESAPDVEGGIDLDTLLASERAVSSICEAAIGACYLHHGFAATAEATVAAFAEQVALASQELLDFKSALQEALARDGEQVAYVVTDEKGPPHDRSFEVVARVDGRELGRGGGRTKKAAEQAAAAEALEALGK